MSLTAQLHHPLDGFDLDVMFEAPTGVTAIMGPSGAGKTSVAKLIAGVRTPRQGRITLSGDCLLDTHTGHSLPPHLRRIGYVFQEPRLFPHLSVRKNLVYGARSGVPDLHKIAELLGLSQLLERRPHSLSGGEAQRVALGRALLSAPRLLILDEPLSALDQARKDEILPYLARIRDQALCPILYISHALSEVAQVADHLIVLDKGRITARGPTAQVIADPGAAGGLGPRNTGALLRGTVQHQCGDDLTEISVSAGQLLVPHQPAPPGAAVLIRVDASDVILSLDPPTGLSALNSLPSTIHGLSDAPSGAVLVQMLTGDDPVLAKITKRSAQNLGLQNGKQIHAIFKSVSVQSNRV